MKDFGDINMTDSHLFHCRDAIVIAIVNCLTSFYGGFVIFSVIGYMANKVGLSVSEVISSGMQVG